ncbi:hypothetical protein BKA69DRAFT_1108291 [Paraphysoderma sedebokerense]|nr:hypothetical protein BKA69DRAFT_1108291 [Paraphysoderma sedebokerense]
MSDSDAEDLKEFGHSLFFDGGLRSEYFFKAAVLSGRLQTLAEKSSNPLALAFAEGLALFFRSDTRRNIPKSRKLAYHSSSDTDHSQRSESHSSRSLSPQVVSMSRSKRPFRSPTKTSPNPVSKKKKKSVVVKPSLNPKRTLPVILDHFLQMTRHCQALKSKPRDYGVKPETTFQSYFKKHWSRYKFNYTFQAVRESYTLGAALVFYPKTTIKELQLISTSIGSKDLYRNAGRIFEESSKNFFSHPRVQRDRITTIKRSIDKVASQFSSEKFAAFGFDHVIKQHMDAGMTEVEFVDLKKNIVQPGSEYSKKDLSDADGDEDEDEEDDINVMLGLGSKEETENTENSDDYGTVLAGVVNGENEEVENGTGLEQSEIENDIDEEFAELGFTPINL